MPDRDSRQRHDQDAIERLLDEAASLERRGDLEQAVAVWTEVLYLSPDEPRALERLRAAGVAGAPAVSDGEGSIDVPVPTFAQAPTLADLDRLLAERRYEEALEVLRAERSRAPQSAEISRGINLLKQRLIRRYLHKIGGLDCVPKNALSPADLAMLTFSTEQEEVLRLIDGIASFGDIAAECALGRFETYRILARLVGSGAIAISPPPEAVATPGAATPSTATPIPPATLMTVAATTVVPMTRSTPAPAAPATPLPVGPPTAPVLPTTPPDELPAESRRDWSGLALDVALLGTLVLFFFSIRSSAEHAAPPRPPRRAPVVAAHTPARPDAGPAPVAVIVHDAPPAPQPDASAPIAIQPPSAEPAPVEPTPVARIGDVDMEGSLARSIVQRAVEHVEPGFNSCYKDAAQRAGRDELATIQVAFVVDETGQAIDITASPAPLDGLADCVRDLTSRIRTQVAPDVGVVHVTFDVTFNPLTPRP